MIRLLKLISITLLATSLLAGCKSDEEKAEEYYQSGLSFLEQGDEDRALIEFRNVFRKNGFHKEARMAYADLQFKRGEYAEAYGQYLRLVEQYPNTVDAREKLARMAIERNDWDEAERHGDAAIKLEGDRPSIRALAAALAYRSASLDRDAAATEKAVAMARAVLADHPGELPARRVLIDYALKSEDLDGALTEVDLALEIMPESYDLNLLKARLLGQKGDVDAIGAHLKVMYELFPDNQEVGRGLISWYVSQRDFDGAEAFLRGEAGADDGPSDGHLTVVQFLLQARGPEAAQAELTRLIAANGESVNSELYIASSATIDFDQGRRDDAIASIETVLKTAEPSDQTRRIKVMLARMLIATDNTVGARARVEEVLVADPSHVDALKMRAAWLIQSDKPDAAIIDLRAALDQNPRDPGILSLMAEAHLRNGSPELAQERLALAVEVSGYRAAESLRYARFSMQRNRPARAESVLVGARRVAPGNIEVLTLLADIYTSQQKWAEAEALIDELEQMPDERAQKLARGIRSAVLLGQRNVEDSLAVMRQDIDDPAGKDLGAVLRVLRTQVSTGRLDEARAYLNELLAEQPESLALRLMDANLKGLQGDLEGAEDRYHEILAEAPKTEPAVMQLVSLLTSTGRSQEAGKILEDGLTAMPASRPLRLLKAFRLEKSGQVDGAIALYEELYDENSGDVVVANNLASLLSAHRRTPEALDKAEVIARRLNGAKVPAFQDTLGWIQYLKGDFDAAIPNLEAAAKGIPNDPSVALHLGLAYAAAGRNDDARRELERGIALAGDRDLPELAPAREALSKL
ncbi:MAG: tetratricopeptide repeat protein [Pseudooceanicola sp.]